MKENILSNEETVTSEAPLSLDECTSVFKSMQNQKGHGSGGFNIEFCKYFWKFIGNFVCRSIN